MKLHWDNCVWINSEWKSWSDLANIGQIDVSAPVAVVSQSLSDAWASFASAVEQKLEFALVSRDRIDEQLRNALQESGFSVVEGTNVSVPPVSRPASPGQIVVLTSGTTGVPKQVVHSLKSLATMASSTMDPFTWLCPYSAGTYAWYQCAVLGLTIPDQKLVPVDATTEPTDWVQLARDTGVDAISTTPTFWRKAMLAVPQEEFDDLNLKQITLGGEPIDQALLDRLRSMFPDARITHIYASSEAGACIAVHDGRTGFPRSWLNSTRSNGVQLRVINDELEIQSPFRSGPASDEWIQTGDRVLVEEDRVQLLGRADDGFLNVGGAKVDARQVASVLMSHPNVAWARVRGRRAPIVGQMPVADIVLTPSGSDTSIDQILNWARAHLAEHAVPRMIQLVNEIPMNTTGKGA